MELVDTNVFLRFILKDHPIQSPKAAGLFQKAKKGSVDLWTTEWVISEIIWVLETYYKKPKAVIIQIVRKILNTKGIKINNKEIVIESINLYETLNIEFEDAINSLLARENQISTIYSFDRHFDRVSFLKRKEP